MDPVTFETPNIKTLNKNFSLVDMHVHTEYSHDCTTKLSDILKKAKKLGVGIAITDHNEVRGCLKALKSKNPPLIIPGIEICSKEAKEVLAYFYSPSELEDFYIKYKIGRSQV